jgi:glycosyltransferase involved in cell wall biosynthesis
MSIKLSICIPTYNRAIELGDCLLSVRQSIGERYQDQVEVIVSNNASVDGTEAAALNHLCLFKHGRYFQNKQNIGADKNVYAVAEHAIGDYIWILGDDDKITCDAIDLILQNIQQPYSMIVVNCSVFNRDFTKMIAKSQVSINQSAIYTDPNIVLSQLHAQIGLISLVIMNRVDFFRTPKPLYLKYIKSGFAHLYGFYAGIFLGRGAVLYNASPLVMYRANNTSEYNLLDYFTSGKELVFSGLLSIGYSKAAVAKAKKSFFTSYWLKNAIFIKTRGDYNAATFIKTMYAHYKSYWAFWFVVVPIWLVPSQLVICIKKTLRVFKRAIRSDLKQVSC